MSASVAKPDPDTVVSVVPLSHWGPSSLKHAGVSHPRLLLLAQLLGLRSAISWEVEDDGELSLRCANMVQRLAS